jgi:hypothetical protein
MCYWYLPPYRTYGRVSPVTPQTYGQLMNRVNYLCTCIAINLMLIICFGVNPNGTSESHFRRVEVRAAEG